MSSAIYAGPSTPDEPVSSIPDPAFEGLYREYAPKISSHLARRLGVRPAEVEDLTQEVFLRAYRARDLIDPTRPIWPFLRTIATRLAIDEHRRADQRRSQLMSEVPETQSRAHDPWEGYIAGERREALAAALSALPARSHRLVLLKDGAGFEYDELARIDGVSVQALRSVISRARRTLRDSYVAQLSSRGLAAAVAPVAALGRVVDRRLRMRRVHETGLAARLAELAPASTNAMLALAAIGVTGLSPATAMFAAAPAQPTIAHVVSAPAAEVAAVQASGTHSSGSGSNAPGSAAAGGAAATPPGFNVAAQTPPEIPAGGGATLGLNHTRVGNVDVANVSSHLGLHAGPWVVNLVASTDFDCSVVTVLCVLADALPPLPGLS